MPRRIDAETHAERERAVYNLIDAAGGASIAMQNLIGDSDLAASVVRSAVARLVKAGRVVMLGNRRTARYRTAA